ncbi:hypothetical protein N8740_01615 [Candidatus Pelagibacter sp.]|jgi:hypothetical protein|nr:hypothetical protein [Candidatus Pelagibacter sp.]
MIIKKNIFILILILYFSLIVGFYYGEDSLGASFSDYMGLLHITEKFKNNFLFHFLNYNDLGHRQSPFFYILNSIIFNFGEIGRRIFFLHIYLLIPIYFYKCLKIKFKNVPKDYLKLFSSIILLFPTFRSYAIWPDPHLLGVLFFTISIFYYLKVKANTKPFQSALLNTFFLSVAAYASPNFGIFVIFFFLEFLKKFYFSKKIFFISLLNIILALPFFFYVFYLNINFIFNNNGWDIGKNIYSLNNISNKIIIILSLFLFYLFPLILAKFRKFKFKLKKLSINFYFSAIVYIFIIFFFNFEESYKLTNSGGGFFYNLSYFLLQNNFLLFFLSFFAYLYLLKIFKFDKSNFILFLCLILSNPQVTLWQANFSPTIFFLILLLFKGVIDEKYLNLKTLIISYSYFFLYLVFNVVIRNVLI